MAGMEARHPTPSSTNKRLRGFIAERVGMSHDATGRSAAQRADQGGNALEPKPRPDGFHRAHVRRLHGNPGFLQGVTPVGHHAPFSGSDDISNLQAHWCRCTAGKRDAVTQGKGAALICVGCRPATGCAGRVGVLGTGAQRVGDAGGWAGAGHRRCLSVVEFLKLRREQLRGLVATISSWNVGLNSSEAAGQTKFHAHWHLFPGEQVMTNLLTEALGGLSKANSTIEPWPVHRSCG